MAQPAPAAVASTAAPALAPSNYVDTHTHLHGILPPMGYTFDQYPEFRKKFFPSNLDAVVNVRYRVARLLGMTRLQLRAGDQRYELVFPPVRWR
jgi:hypothetical protein